MVLAVVLSTLAIFSDPVVPRDVQARVTTLGIIASRFEQRKNASARVPSVEDMFEERSGRKRSARVAMIKTNDGDQAYATVARASGHD